MIKHENDCVDCGLPCMGSTCPLRNVVHIYCDECGEEGRIYHFDGRQLCIDCIAEELDEVEADYEADDEPDYEPDYYED